jgi:GDPmannose 4,6-dehydratase
MKIKWRGKEINEKAYDENNNCIIQIDKRYFRPLEVHNLKGNFSKAKKILKWKPKKTLNQLVEEMIKYELEINDQ